MSYKYNIYIYTCTRHHQCIVYTNRLIIVLVCTGFSRCIYLSTFLLIEFIVFLNVCRSSLFPFSFPSSLSSFFCHSFIDSFIGSLIHSVCHDFHCMVICWFNCIYCMLHCVKLNRCTVVMEYNVIHYIFTCYFHTSCVGTHTPDSARFLPSVGSELHSKVLQPGRVSLGRKQRSSAVCQSAESSMTKVIRNKRLWPCWQFEWVIGRRYIVNVIQQNLLPIHWLRQLTSCHPSLKIHTRQHAEGSRQCDRVQFKRNVLNRAWTWSSLKSNLDNLTTWQLHSTTQRV